ncbi:hypothetical protein G7Y89_g4590 [Cudoniella acicularis]|uniref:Xylanolytic transcriptional activator regulatory domain-containing protein n=1 Tax=Cudoniella acicularis TaxID=354080 RepID=A0A8H4RQF4_9HELO|nr:hypothetical protein G7Y89_g4590 [Cudoniella acicularis]
MEERLVQSLSSPDRTPIHNVANDKQDLASDLDDLPLASRADCSMQNAGPVRLYEYFHNIHEKLGLTNDIHIDGTDYRSMLCLADELRKREILQYLVHQELENNREFKRFLLNPNASVPTEEYYWLWKRAVRSSTKQKLTKESDRFIALEGVTRYMTLLLNDECILGVWKKDALHSLISVNSPVQYRLWHPYGRYVDRRGESMLKRAVILGLSARRENSLGFDKFSGKLTVVGSLTGGYLFNSIVYFARSFKKLKSTEAGNTTGRYYIEDALLGFYSEPKYIPVLSDRRRLQEKPTIPEKPKKKPQKDTEDCITFSSEAHEEPPITHTAQFSGGLFLLRSRHRSSKYSRIFLLGYARQIRILGPECPNRVTTSCKRFNDTSSSLDFTIQQLSKFARYGFIGISITTSKACVYALRETESQMRQAPTMKRQTNEDLMSRISRYEKIFKSHNIDFSTCDSDSRWIPSAFESKLGEKAQQSANVSSLAQEMTEVSFSAAGGGVDKNPWVALSPELRNPPLQRLATPKACENDNLNQASIASSPFILEGILLPSLTSFTPPLELHPEPRQIFKLWQTFVENSNPLIKIVHVPTLQQRIFEGVWNLQSIPKSLDAILFAVYTLAITSLSPAECLKQFGETKAVLLNRYHKGMIQSLSVAGLVTTRELEMLQAFVLFLMADPSSDATCTLSAVALRIGYKIGLHREKRTQNITFFEAEMRIRLWWQIRGLDARARRYASGHIPPSEYCHVRMPLNINDSELHPHMVHCPVEHIGATEMLYPLLKYEFANWLRISLVAAKFSRQIQGDSLLQSLTVKDQAIQELEEIFDNYLRYCDPKIPLHSLSLAMTRLSICRLKFMAHHPRKREDRGAHMSLEERNLLFENGVRLLELENECRNTPFSQQLLSHMTAVCQLDAFIFVISELRYRATGDLVGTAWSIAAIFYEEHPELIDAGSNTFYIALGDLTVKAWETRQRELLHSQENRMGDITPPFIKALMSERPGIATEKTFMQSTEVFGNLVSSTIVNQGAYDAAAQFQEMGNTAGIGINPYSHLPTGFDDQMDLGYWDEFMQV